MRAVQKRQATGTWGESNRRGAAGSRQHVLREQRQRLRAHGEHMGLTGGDSDAENPLIVMGSEEGGAKGHRETNRSVSDRSLSGKRSRAHGRARARAMGQWLRYDVGRGTRFGGVPGGWGAEGGAANGASTRTSDRGPAWFWSAPPLWWWRCLSDFSVAP